MIGNCHSSPDFLTLTVPDHFVYIRLTFYNGFECYISYLAGVWLLMLMVTETSPDGEVSGSLSLLQEVKESTNIQLNIVYMNFSC